MPEKNLPSRPNLAQYKKQAKELLRNCRLEVPDAVERFRLHHPGFADTTAQAGRAALADAQLVIAREHGFPSWPRFAAHIETLRIARVMDAIEDPVAAFIVAACVPRDGDHGSGTLEEAEQILLRFPQVATANIYTAAILADQSAVREFLQYDAASATAPGGPHGWDALTHLCFSRYLRLDADRSEAFVRTARLLLEAGADANTGWWETIDLDTKPRQIPERAIYGAAGIAQHPGVTRLLLEYGADPNDEETPYHVPETGDNTVLQILLESGRLNANSVACILGRKADWHDIDGMRLVLEHQGDPNALTSWGRNALHHAIQRDNGLDQIRLLLDHNADPNLGGAHDGRSAIAMAARRGRADILALFEERGIELQLSGVDQLITACAMADHERIHMLLTAEPELRDKLLAESGTLLAEFAGTGNAAGVKCLLEIGVPVDALYEGDVYFQIAPASTALHVAAWRAWAGTVRVLLEHGAPVNVQDHRGHTPLQFAVRACVDSYWQSRRTPDIVRMLLAGGASTDGVEIPTGYDAIDALFAEHARAK